MEQEWKPILNHENYEINEFGEVRRRANEKIVKLTIDDREYVSVMLWTNNKQYKRRIARILWNTFNDCECKHTVDHIDQNKKNNHISNLRCISNEDNCKNRPAYSNKTNKYNLTPELKKELMTKFKNKEISSYKIYKDYGIPSNYFFTMVKRGKWDKI